MNSKLKNKIKVVATILIFLALVSSAIYYFVEGGRETEIENTKTQLSKGFSITKAKIIRLSSYKGHSMLISYKILGVDYENVHGWTYQKEHFNEGDSIMIKYALNDPAIAVTEFEDLYDEID